MSIEADERRIQREYYSKTAEIYDDIHISGGSEHRIASLLLLAAIDDLQIQSILDIGSGTGRTLTFLKTHRPHLRVVGIEPVAELREIGHRKGLGRHELMDGDATKLAFPDGAFDMVCEFAVLHHIRHPNLAVAEMLRVARRGIFISDSNNFGQGGRMTRWLKQLINALGLWKLADQIKTRGKGYTISEGDGLAYSYSVFNDYPLIQNTCHRVHLMNTSEGGINPYRTASNVALLGIKH